MIATITLNPSLDEHITVDRLMVEETNRWHRLRRYAAGKGIDVSRAIHEMGGGTELCHRDDVERLLPQIKVWEIPARRGAKVLFSASQ